MFNISVLLLTKLNLEKSETCWIGRARGLTDAPINCKWVDLNNEAILWGFLIAMIMTFLRN